jgi:hypothetical protein
VPDILYKIIYMSCLFNSISHFISENSGDARKKICDYLESNNDIMEGIQTKDVLNMESTNYIESMRNTSTWGGAIEIQAACNIWNMSIIVHNIRDNNRKITFLPIRSGVNKTINITWNGGHYEPI